MRSVIRMSNIAFATLLLSLLVFASQSVQAAPTVINTADAGAGSLRQAIIDATSAAAATTIDFNIPLGDPGYDSVTDRFTITLLTPLPNIPLAPLTINNATGRGVTVKGGSSFRVFTLVDSAVVIINNLTISNGNSNGVGNLAKGGGIFMGNSAVLTLNNCIVSDNTATGGGGGIWMNNSGVLFLNDSTIRNNTTTGENGGGIRIFDSGTLNITSSTVSGNHADATAPAGGGGGIYNGVSGTVTANNITVSGNTAGNQGGGINNSGVPATATINSSTISSNTATIGGGGIFNGPTTTATLNNSLVALNTGALSPDLLGPFTANSSLIGNADNSTISGANNQLGTTAVPINPLLGPLQNNGGPPLTPFTPTFTRALLAGSPAIDTGATALPTDQRGVTRPQDGDGAGGAQADIGSYESRGLLEPPPPTTNTIQFSAANYTVAESGASPSIVITVLRTGDTTQAATVDYVTSDDSDPSRAVRCDVVNTGIASSRCDFTTAIGRLSFAAGQTSKTFTVLINQDSYLEGLEGLLLALSNPTGGAVLGTPATALLQIMDDANPSATNVIDGTGDFVRQHYLDFLNREAETGGFNAWVNLLNGCAPGNTACDRVTVSQSFFGSPEFKSKGYFATRFYFAAFNRNPLFLEFIGDLSRLNGATPAESDAAKASFPAEFTQRAEFKTTFDSLNNTQYVDKLIANTGVAYSNRNQLIADLTSATKTRAQVLNEIVEATQFVQNAATFNRAFVLAEYFGYLRRNPETPGFNMWIVYLQANPSDFRTMVNGFVNSIEYRLRFGTP